MKPDTRNNMVMLEVFGCQMNKLDAELVKSLLHAEGYGFTQDRGEAGVILFLTCSVRDHAEARVHSRLGALKAWKKERPDALLGIMGCMAQKDGEALVKQHPHLDLVVGTRDFQQIADLLQEAAGGTGPVLALDQEESPAVARNESLRAHPFKAFLGIMRGCDRYCAYCVVPYVRGRETSRPMDDIVEEAARLVKDGVSEITLLGQTVNRYDDGKGNRLSHLLRRLNELPGLGRLSFITSYPAYVDDDLIEAMANCDKVTRSLHLPAQSGSDEILKRMKRRYTAAAYLEVTARLREAMPDLEMASDFIVGFPGETEADFKATEALMEAVRFQQSFVFKYSPRPGTLAAKKFEDDIPRSVKEERNARLLALQKRISLEKNAGLVGKVVEVLVEGVSHRDSSRYIGRTRYNQIAAFPASPEMVGRYVKVRVGETTALTLLGDEVVEVIS